ncbi:MAG TPA: uroporphyrinogen decarboxylase family protein [Armatimonadota bacterium]|jgi:uroporphyrinogen decarboxylase
MTRQDRFLTALHNQQPDRVPLFDFLFQQPLYEELIGHRPGGYNGPDAVQCALALDHDAVWLPFGGFSNYQPTFLSEDVYVDEWGTTYQHSPSSWPIDAPIAYPITSRADLAKYELPDPTREGRDAEIRAAAALDHDGLALVGGVQGPLTTAWLLMGYENIALAMYDDPGLVEAVLKLSNEFFLEAARRSVAAGAVAVFVSEDLGSSTGGFFKLDHYRRYLLPPFAEIVAEIDSLGVPALLHACGRIYEYLPDLAETKLSAIHPLQRTAGMDLRRVKEEWGHRWCLIGNIDSSRTLPYGTPEQVAAEVREAIDVAAPGGGYILASDHSLHDGIPIANIREMFRVGAEYGRAAYQ